MKNIEVEEKKNEPPCPCMSGSSYISCCAKYHTGLSKSETAEQLMRSRYTAYHMSLIDYLVNTTHPNKLRPNYRHQLESTKDDMDWTGLKIISSSMGTKTDKIGKVRFIAQYVMKAEKSSMEEHSRFRRYKGDWVYYDEKG
ncbi:MAG: SEC-C motif-containing protein [Halioglobus sp.]|jgi:SEC-C motif-containing protein